jgi:hypothetical protein
MHVCRVRPGAHALGALLAAHAAAFAPLLRGARSFVPWDDPENFEQAHGWKGLRLRHLRWALTSQQCVLLLCAATRQGCGVR